MTADLAFYVAAGFFAQLIDSSLGMAFGTLSSALLLSHGFPPPAISATVHAAEIFSGGVSAFAHYRLKNIDWELVKKLAPPAIAGALLGSVLVIYFPADGLMKQIIAAYFIIVGLVIVLKSVGAHILRTVRLGVAPVGFLGGFLDAFGGAGWGEFTSSGLILQGREARTVVGSINTVEFMITAVISLVFFALASVTDWRAVAAIALGGMLAAPLGAWVCKRAPVKGLTLAVGMVVMLLGIKSLFTL